MFEEYTGIKDATVKYACGACDATKKTEGKCAECGEDDCNAIVTAASFKCDNYEFKDEAFTKASAQTTCQRLKDTKAICKK